MQAVGTGVVSGTKAVGTGVVSGTKAVGSGSLLCAAFCIFCGGLSVLHRKDPASQIMQLLIASSVQ